MPEQNVSLGLAKLLGRPPALIIRLLLVADHFSNSGKLRLDKGGQFNFHGFKTVYLFQYPEEVIVLENATDS